MQTQAINADSKEVHFAKFTNNSGGTITKGYPAVLDIVATQLDGNSVSKPATATLSLFVGLAVRDILDEDDGMFQCYGYHTDGFVTNATDQAIAAGDILIPVDGAFHLARSGAGDGKSGFVFAAEAFATATTPAAVAQKVFIKAL